MMLYPNESYTSPKTTKTKSQSWWIIGLTAVLMSQSVAGFVNTPITTSVAQSSSLPSLLFATPTPDEDISRQIARAKELLAKSKAKIEARKMSSDNDTSTTTTAAVTTTTTTTDPSDEDRKPNVPFFASMDTRNNSNMKREKVMKYRNEETGLFTTDGDLMAELSESEAWERRSLFEIFKSEIEQNEGSASERLAERDVAASIFNLRKSLQNEDYRAIFDKSNRFIGEDN